MDPGQRLAIELACSKLPLLFARFADAGDHEAMHYDAVLIPMDKPRIQLLEPCIATPEP